MQDQNSQNQIQSVAEIAKNMPMSMMMARQPRFKPKVTRKTSPGKYKK